MLTEYVEEALRRAHYELMDDPDEPYYGEVPDLQGVWAAGRTLEECRAHLKDVHRRLDFAQRQAIVADPQARGNWKSRKLLNRQLDAEALRDYVADACKKIARARICGPLQRWKASTHGQGIVEVDRKCH